MHIDPMWGAAGLTASAGLAGWIEMLMLRKTLNVRIGHTGLPADYIVKLWISSAAGAATAWLVKLILPSMHPMVSGIFILGSYGLVFLGGTFLMRIPEASTALSRLRRGV
jgi:putative peptidoglycan lipid II flippase